MRQDRGGVHGLGLPPPWPGLHCGVLCFGDHLLPCQLPPAIRPGLHCGHVSYGGAVGCRSAFPRTSGRGSIAATSSPSFMVMACALPPAIRPGLHCGAAALGGDAMTAGASPGHQAGAPLRRRAARHTGDGPHNFPRPSGRGSIAATSCRAPGPRRCAASPGHQAGAPLRRRLPALHGHRHSHLPPAIRPGLHCGPPPRGAVPPRHTTFPRPSGRGSIAAVSRKRRST